MKNERIEIGVCTKDRFTECSMLLQSLLQQTYKEWDLIIIDGSHPQPITVSSFAGRIMNQLKLQGHSITVLKDTGFGVCDARNQALQESPWKRKLHLRIDDDSICEPDFVERMVKAIQRDKKIGAVGCLVPGWGTSPYERNLQKIKPIASPIEFDEEGNVIKIGDDFAFFYNRTELVPTHHVRSSFIMRRKAWEDVGGYEKGLGRTGFREESFLSLRMIKAGWKLYADAGAICWHQQASTGGVRSPEYVEKVTMIDQYFRDWVKENGFKAILEEYNASMLKHEPL